MAGLAGHLPRGMITVDGYLAGPEPGEAAISAVGYFHTLIRSADRNDAANEAVRICGAEAAAGGPLVVARQARSVAERLSPLLAGVPPRRRLRVAGGRVMTLEEYLRTCVVELVVHADDLAASVGVELARHSRPQPRLRLMCLLRWPVCGMERWQSCGP